MVFPGVYDMRPADMYFVHRFQNIVPISLYMSIEFVRTCQAAFIYFDRDMFYEKTQQPTLARSWNLSDDLGQIEYIFSDKTGTLTQVCSFMTFIFPYRFRPCVDNLGLSSEFNGVSKMYHQWKGVSR